MRNRIIFEVPVNRRGGILKLCWRGFFKLMKMFFYRSYLDHKWESWAYLGFGPFILYYYRDSLWYGRGKYRVDRE
jgi:hypothetical protein